MKYLNKTFSVAMGSKDYRDNFDKIDWGKSTRHAVETAIDLSKDKDATYVARTHERPHPFRKDGCFG